MKRLLLALVFATPVLSQSPIAVPIQNSSFELVSLPFNPDPATCGQRAWGNGASVLPGWTFINEDTGELWGGGAETFVAPCLLPTPPDGKNAAWLEGQSHIVAMSQDTGIIASDLQNVPGTLGNGFYTMEFYIVNVFGAYPGYFEAKIHLGVQELCSNSGWATEIYQKLTFVCLSPRYLVFDQWPTNVPSEPPVGQFDPKAHIIISIGSSGWPVLPDKVSLTFTPTN